MAPPKRKAAFSAEPAQLERIQEVVHSGRYRTSSEFLREAIDEKLARLRREELAAEVDRYCAQGLAGEDAGLVESQAFDRDP